MLFSVLTLWCWARLNGLGGQGGVDGAGLEDEGLEKGEDKDYTSRRWEKGANRLATEPPFPTMR